MSSSTGLWPGYDELQDVQLEWNPSQKPRGARRITCDAGTLRMLLHFWLLTPISAGEIAKLLTDKGWDPKPPGESTIRAILKQLLGPNYSNYHKSRQEARVLLDARLRVLKDDQPALARFACHETPSIDLLPALTEETTPETMSVDFEVHDSQERNSIRAPEETKFRDSVFPLISQPFVAQRSNRLSMAPSLTSTVQSMVSSVARFSVQSMQRPFKQSSQQSTRFTKERKKAAQSAVAKLFRRLKLDALTDRETVIWNDIIDETSLACPERDNVLNGQRDCCNIKQQLWREQHYGNDEARLSRCSVCKLSDIHYSAANSLDALESLDENQINLVDAFGNTALHFAAGRDCDIFHAVTILIGRGISTSTVNAAGQNFLFAINPAGINTSSFIQLLDRVLNKDAGFDLNHKDCHGQTFLHCLIDDFQVDMAYGCLFSYLYHKSYDFTAPDNRGIILNNHPKTKSTNFTFALRTTNYPARWGDVTYKFELEGTTMTMRDEYIAHIGSEFWTRYDETGETFLMSYIRCTAANEDWVDPCNVIKHYGDARILNLRNRSGESAIFIALRLGLPWIVNQLLCAGAAYNVENYAGSSLLEVGCDIYSHALDADEYIFQFLKRTRIMLCIMIIVDFSLGCHLPASHVYQTDCTLDWEEWTNRWISKSILLTN